MNDKTLNTQHSTLNTQHSTLNTAISIVLNTHIPQSDRPWAYEALFHCYLPLFKNIKNYPVTMGFSPQLIYEFTSPEFKDKSKKFHSMMIERSSHIEVEHLKKYYTDYYNEQFNLLEENDFDTQKMWKDNNWEILAYPSTHCVLPLVTEKLARFFIEKGEETLKEYFEVDDFKGIWLPEMAFEDGVNNLKKILEERYEYIFGNWKTVKNVGSYNKLYETPEGLKVVIRNDNTQQFLWGSNSRIASLPEYRETHRMDDYGNKIFRVGGGIYYPEDIDVRINQTVKGLDSFFQDEAGDYIALMFDTEYFGHHWWEGDKFLIEFLSNLNKSYLLTCSQISKKLTSRPIDLTGMSYTWGSTGEDRGNSNLDTWVNGKVHKMLQKYREKMIEVDKWGKEELNDNLYKLNKFFSSDWLFIESHDVMDISTGNLVDVDEDIVL